MNRKQRRDIQFSRLEVIELTSECEITDDQCLDVHQLEIAEGVKVECNGRSDDDYQDKILGDCENSLILGKGSPCPEDCSQCDLSVLGWFGKFKPSKFCENMVGAESFLLKSSSSKRNRFWFGA